METEEASRKPARAARDRGDHRCPEQAVKKRPDQYAEDGIGTMTTILFPEFTPDAKARWQEVPLSVRTAILKSVWCVACMQGVPMELASGSMEDDCLILRGKCKICGHAVARLVEPDE